MLQDKKIKDILKQHKLSPKKRFGQNFLINKNISEKIVQLADIQPLDTVIEVGVGFGALTLYLAEICTKVIGVEIDSGIIRFHRDQGTLPANVSLVHQDILKADFRKLAEESGGRIKLIANLPYSISNPLLFELVKHSRDMEWAVLMLQKEVAQRLTAVTGSKDYGIISVYMAACASIQKLLDLGPQHFHPRPKVDSRVVKITFHPVPERAAALPDYDSHLFRQIVSAAFQQRRKTLINSLSAAKLPNIDKKIISAALDEMGLEGMIRGEKLQLEEFVALTNILHRYSTG